MPARSFVVVVDGQEVRLDNVPVPCRGSKLKSLVAAATGRSGDDRSWGLCFAMPPEAFLSQYVLQDSDCERLIDTDAVLDEEFFDNVSNSVVEVRVESL
eukprot:m51a1_g6744 hypothetical protein (99) ;mRNA; f:263927-264282